MTDKVEAEPPPHDEPTSLSSAKGCGQYPTSVWFILLSELCERFSYYGMRAVLILYLKDFLFLSDNTSVVIYHLFTMGCYFSPLFGGWVSDTYWGRFKTIVILSIVYVAGSAVLTVGSIPGLYPSDTSRVPVAAFIGMALIAIGTGGIKPCVSAFGGDQLTSAAQLTTFFTIFYICIINRIVADDCYPAATESLPENTHCRCV